MTDLYPWDDPTAVLPIELHGEPVPKARARIRVLGGKVSSYTPSGTVLAQAHVADVVRALGFQPTDAYDFALSIRFRQGSWQRRDIDNLAKLVLDAMTGVVWVDDAQIVRQSQAKVYGERPGAMVTVWEL
jgi:crossover junction endodeoxyribonuclease RusA